MHGKDLKISGTYDGKCNNGLKNPCECDAPVLPVFSPIFYALYLIARLSDMADRIIAQKTNTVSEFGSRFDSITDFVFVTGLLSLIEKSLFMGMTRIVSWM